MGQTRLISVGLLALGRRSVGGVSKDSSVLHSMDRTYRSGGQGVELQSSELCHSHISVTKSKLANRKNRTLDLSYTDVKKWLKEYSSRDGLKLHN